MAAILSSGPLRAQVVIGGGGEGRTGDSVPPIMSYQGRVVLGGVNFQGNGQFKFALVTDAMEGPPA